MDYYDWSPDAAPKDGKAPLPVLPHGDPHPSKYVPHPDLVRAVNLALVLGKPLLLTGDPGVGKTELGASVAWRLGLNGPYKFTAKSNSEARDLFYRYDAIGRFQAIEAARAAAATPGVAMSAPSTDARDFIQYVALGRAILQAQEQSPELDAYLPRRAATEASGSAPNDNGAFVHDGVARRSVVIIDEIDKASRDFMNDLLEELEQMTFSVPELVHVGARAPRITDRAYWPVVFLTSNAERAFPEPFLRRCLYFHIPFPAAEPQSGDRASLHYNLENLVALRLGEGRAAFARTPLIYDAIRLFAQLREEPLHKKPSTAELLNWIATLKIAGCIQEESASSTNNRDAVLECALITLLKSDEDQAAGRSFLGARLSGKK